VRSRSLPHNFVFESFRAKDLVENGLCVMADMPIEMDVDAAVFGKE
jgi:hypothetical protein